MVTAVDTEPAAAPPTGEDLVHAVCWCDSEVALCGADVAGSEWAGEEEDVDCVVCRDLVVRPCWRCGG